MGEASGDGIFTLTGYTPVSSFTGKAELKEWMQCSIPLESLIEETTWGAFTANHNQVLNFYITYPNCTKDTKIEIYVDNFRIMPIQQSND